MRPVEIEFLVKDSTKAGAQRVSASIDRETMKILGRMDRIQTKIDKLRTTNSDALDQDKNIAEIKKLEGQLDKLQAKMAKVSAQKSIGPSSSEIDKTARSYNGLNLSIQQIARELPAAAMGPQMFFMAISNNLPIFADELSRARKEYDALIAAGQKGTPVWKQMLSSIVSWQTALAVGVMLVVTYGDEIAKWVSNLFKGKEAIDSVNVAAEQFHSTIAQGSVSAQKEATSLELLYNVATDTSKAYAERKRAVEELQQTYPAYFANLSAEQVMLGSAITSYEKLRDTIYQVAQAKAAEGRLVQIAENQQLLEATESMQRYNATYKELATNRQAYNDAQRRLKESEGTRAFVQASKDADRAAQSYNQSLKSLNRIQKDVFKELESIEGGEDLIAIIQDTYGGDLRKFLDTEGKLRQQLMSIAESSYTQEDYKNGAKASAPILKKDLYNQLLQARRDLEDQQDAIIEDAYEKRRAMAKTEFERQLHDIRINREKLLAEDKSQTGGVNATAINTIFDAQMMAVAEQYNQSLLKIQKDEQDAADKAYDNLLQKYETYLQKRERLAQQYDRDIAALTLSPENQLIAEQAKDKALKEFDVAFASQFPEFERWADSIVNVSVTKLRELIALAEHELEQMESVNNADPEAMAKLRAQIVMLEQRLAEAQGKTSSAGGGDEYERWERLSEALGRVNDDLQEIGDTLGGVFGEIIDTAGSITTSTLSIISGIQSLSKSAVEGIQSTADGASAAIKGIEKASVILGIISAALSIWQALSSLFKNTESSQERSIRLAREFNEELRIMNERARINQDDDSIFGDAVYRNFRQNIDVMRQALQDLDKDKKALLWRGTESAYDAGFRPWESESDSIANMKVQTQHSTWFRSAKYASLKDLIPELFGDDGQINMEALAKFADESNDTFQKLSDKNKKLIKSLVADWETYEEALSAMRDYLSSIFGELGDTIMDSMIAVADGTMSAADAMTMRLEALSDTVREFAKNMIYAMTIGPLLEQAQKDIEEVQTGTGTDEEKFDATLGILEQLIDDAAKEQENATYLWEKFKALSKEKGFDLGETTSQSGKAGAMYTVSQDSFTRAEGILTSIQAHIIAGELKIDNITVQLSQQLDALNAIVANTSPISQIYMLMATIYRDGLKVQ